MQGWGFGQHGVGAIGQRGGQSEDARTRGWLDRSVGWLVQVMDPLIYIYIYNIYIDPMIIYYWTCTQPLTGRMLKPGATLGPTGPPFL
jgi:hypothetical protein